MKRLLIITIILLLWANPAWAIELDELPEFHYEIGQIEREPTQCNTWGEQDAFLLFLRIIDWGQTRDIADSLTVEHGYAIGNDGRKILTYTRTYYKYTEANPLLGEHPSLEKVDTYFTLCILLDMLVAQYTNPKFHKWWNIVGITLETYCVSHNIQSGVKFKF